MEDVSRGEDVLATYSRGSLQHGRTEMAIVTKDPMKWRLVDTVKEQVWRYDPMAGWVLAGDLVWDLEEAKPS